MDVMKLINSSVFENCKVEKKTELLDAVTAYLNASARLADAQARCKEHEAIAGERYEENIKAKKARV